MLQTIKSLYLDKDFYLNMDIIEIPTLCGLSELSFDYPVLELGYTTGHIWSPARLLLHQTCAATAVTWLETDACFSSSGCCQ